jgi:hypothetical protein
LHIVDLERFVTSRLALHALAEHVVCVARHAAVGKIGLRATAGGFGTPHFGDDRRVMVVGVEIAREQYGRMYATPITTLAAAGAWVEVAPGAPDEVFTPMTSHALDEPLTVHPDDAAMIAEWFASGDAVLAQWCKARDLDSPSLVQLWPEHFDLACDLGDEATGTRANYGFSPGDSAILEPYAYVGPWETSRGGGEFWDQPWGASRRLADLGADRRGAALEFFTAARTHLDAASD